jgi:hypothetical protein
MASAAARMAVAAYQYLAAWRHLQQSNIANGRAAINKMAWHGVSSRQSIGVGK